MKIKSQPTDTKQRGVQFNQEDWNWLKRHADLLGLTGRQSLINEICAEYARAHGYEWIGAYTHWPAQGRGSDGPRTSRKIFVDLSDGEKRDIREVYETTDDKTVKLRMRALLLSAQGREIKEIADAIKRHHATVRRWIREYQRGGLEVASKPPATGHVDKAPASYVNRLVEIATENPDLTYREMRERLKTETGLDYTWRTLRKYLSEYNLRE